MGKSYFGSCTRYDFMIALDIFLKYLRTYFDDEDEFEGMGSWT